MSSFQAEEMQDMSIVDQFADEEQEVSAVDPTSLHGMHPPMHLDQSLHHEEHATHNPLTSSRSIGRTGRKKQQSAQMKFCDSVIKEFDSKRGKVNV